MSERTTAPRLRRFLLITAGIVAVGVPVELGLAGHTGDLVQWVPFGLAGALLASVIVTGIAPRRRVVAIHRLVMVIVVAGSVFGVFKHVQKNIAFERAIRPTATTRDVVWHGLRGVSPPLAPGILALAAILAAAGTYGMDQEMNHGDRGDHREGVA